MDRRSARGWGLSAVCSLALLAAATPPLVLAQQAAKKVVRTQDDLPRYTYPVSGSVSDLLTADDATFAAFAAKIRADVDSEIDGYDIQDHETLRGLLDTRLQLQMLSGTQDNAALDTIARIRTLEDKPDAKLMSGVRNEAILKARMQTVQSSGPAYEKAYGQLYAAAIAPLPWATVGVRIKESKSSAQIITANLLQGEAKADLEDAVAKSHALSSEAAAELVNLRFNLKVIVPVKAMSVAVLSKEVADKNVQKPDIWAARDVTLTDADKLTPVTVAIWDTGSDLSLFPGRIYTDPHPNPQFDPHGLAFDLHSFPTHGELFPLTPEQARLYPSMRSDMKGLLDLQQSIDSPEADALRAKLGSMPADKVPAFFEALSLFGNYVHGTHVTGLAARGNPAIRLAVARLTSDWKNVPDPPTEEWMQRYSGNYQTYVKWFRDHGVRVVNMSWKASPSDYETALEKNGIGKTAEERKALARHYFEIDRDGLYAAIKSAPNILFVCGAGNSDSNNGFTEDIPSSFRLPNLLTVAAVDQAGDEVAFTSYGDNVLVDANGYQVESTVPGGANLQMSGTSMASPNTANLAAKLLALDPKLTPPQVIHLIVAGSTASADGRRHNIDPKASVALLHSGKAPAG